MQTYLEIQVPLRTDARWFERLRTQLDSFPVRWQQGFHHITIAFIEHTPEQADICRILDKYFKHLPAINITFDKIDVFTAGRETQIIHLTSTQVPQSFISLTDSIRRDLVSVGCKLQSGFKLHVTLGRVKSPDINQKTILKQINDVAMPKISLSLTDVDYREYRGSGRVFYETKLKKEE